MNEYKFFDKYTKSQFKHGMRFTTYCHGQKTYGKITIVDGNIYLCQDVIRGTRCSNTQGYTGSWILIDNVDEEPFSEFKLIFEDYRQPISIGGIRRGVIING